MKNKDRNEAFKKNSEVEEILTLLDNNLSSIEDKFTNNVDSSVYPPIFIFGCARSGTTIIHQYLIQNINCTFPSNFISRFYYAPYLGGLYYKLFTDLDTRGELLGGKEHNTKGFYSSDLGKTEGPHAPNEFWYFWRKHFSVNKEGAIDRSKINKEKAHRFRNSIFALQNLFKGPFIAKGMIANNCIDYLEELFPEPIFIFIKRDLFANAKSLYNARISYFGNPEKWYSFYPKEKEHYQQLNPEEQVVRQVLDTNKVIENSLSRCNKSRIIRIDYAAFCRAPKQLLEKIQEVDQSVNISTNPLPSQFTIRNKKNLTNEVDIKIKAVIESINKA